MDYPNLTEGMEHAFKRTLQKLIFLDSLMGRGPLQAVGSLISLPEFEVCLTTWQYFEIAKHSRSYSEVLRGIYDNPGEVFDESFNIPELMYLAKSISGPYNECLELATDYNKFQIDNLKDVEYPKLKELKRAVLKLFVTINILEGIRFYSGFASIWAIHYGSGMLHRTSKILQLICRDENLHLHCSQFLLKQLRENPLEGFKEVYEEMRPEIRQMYEDAYNEEIAWIDYLFSKGSYLGMNKDIAIQYMKYNFNKRLKAIDEPIMFKGFDKNPISWVDTYINMDGVEVEKTIPSAA